ncbi:uncharacterized protein LOC128987484 [Macrosteles quadrilineatus]|uniref:uncharacterized protein LOC128987484 n=1 Tax=Macrosteles quadrilineatus TaxID=74068 RepID=UPI0023E2E68E|nr:uncharacterized protein LOC128987484 [Macrosteles quadrilineatus]
MNNIFLLILCLLASSPSVKSGTEDEFLKAFQKGLEKSIKSYIRNNLEILSQILKKPSVVETPTYPKQLTPQVIDKALLNLKRALPETIPMFPFAVAEPITSVDILFFFGILNSRFKNLTDFICSSQVENSVSTSSISVNFHINSSSLEGHYELDVSNYDMHLYGDGDYRITTNGTDIAFHTNIEISMDDSFTMRDFIFNVSITTAELTMTNLLNGDPSANNLTDYVSKLMPAEVATMNDMFQQTVNSSVVHFTNDYIASIMSWREIVDFVYILAEI